MPPFCIVPFNAHILHDIRSDGRLEDIGKRVGVLSRRTVGAVDGDGRSACHIGGGCDGGSVAVQFDN